MIDYFWYYKIKFNIHNQKNWVFISDELNAFASYSNDNYKNIFPLPTCITINSFNVDKPEIFLLSSKPFPTCIIYSNKNKKLMTINVNVHLIIEKEIYKKTENIICFLGIF